jgi:hypothetical protein
LEIKDIKKEVILYTIISAAAAELISLPLIGPNIFFPYGLAIGTCIAIINLNIISKSIDRAVETGRKAPVTLGLIVRILLYGGGFLLAAGTSGLSGLGAAIGFLLPRAVLYITKALAPAIKRKITKEPAAVYVTDTSSNLFIKEPWIVRYRKGRTYITYRHYRKIRWN